MNQGYEFCTNRLAVIGEGSRRVCYRVRRPGLCAKFYRDPSSLSPQAGLRVRFHILLARFSRWLNINRRESRYHQELRRLLPADLLSVFPEQMEPIYSPEHGWGVVESLILNLDGTPARKVCREIRRVDDPALRKRPANPIY